MSDTQRLACNREPFATDDSCDRGDVDIDVFEQFPLCEVIDPTIAETAPPTFDFPVVPFSPPPCACVAIDTHVESAIESRKDVLMEVDFKSVGDCCEGNYEAEVDLRIPCVPFGVRDSGRKSIVIGKGASPEDGCGKPSGNIAVNLKVEDCTLSVSGR